MCSCSQTPKLRILLLAALFALFAVAGFAQTVPAGTQTPVAQQAPASTAEFLATLAAAPGSEVLPPAPKFLSTTCTSNADCPTGQLCCYPCGIDGCNFVCTTPIKGRCPLYP